jgi:hypothetical protein
VANRSPISISPQGEEVQTTAPTLSLIEAWWGLLCLSQLMKNANFISKALGFGGALNLLGCTVQDKIGNKGRRTFVR